MARRDLRGQVFDGRYRIIEPIGKGAMGSVYRGEDLRLGRVVAVKVINDHVPSEMSSRRRFEREAMAMAKLEHPHCASVLDVGLHEDVPFVVMDFVSGENLKEIVEAGPLPIARAVEITRQVLSGLAHAHERGIVHRDIKPANIVLSQKSGLGDHAKILDFGLAKFNQETSNLTSGVVIGTPSYMAPEQILGQAIDQRVDLYACGVLLFELLTGTKPFQSASNEPVQVCMMHLNVPPPRLSEVLPGPDFGVLEDVVRRALAKKRDDRFATATDFAAALAVAAGGSRPRPTPPAGLATSVLPSSAVVPPPPDASLVPSRPDAPVVPTAPALSASESHPRARSDRRRRLAIGVGGLVIAGTTLVVFVTTRAPSGAAAPPAERLQAPVAVDALPPSVRAVDPLVDLLARAEQLVSAGRREAAIDLLVKARKTYPDDARLPYHAGLIYLDRMWWADGLKQLRAAISLDPAYKTDAQLIKAVMRGFNTTATYDWTLASFLRKDVGSAAKPYLEDTARDHQNPLIRKRAAAELRRY